MTRDELVNRGAWAAIIGGAAGFVVLLGLDFVAGRSLPYPYSVLNFVAAALPAAGVAALFLQAQAVNDNKAGEPAEGEEE